MAVYSWASLQPTYAQIKGWWWQLLWLPPAVDVWNLYALWGMADLDVMRAKLKEAWEW